MNLNSECSRPKYGFIIVELLISIVILSAGILFIIDSAKAPIRAIQEALTYEQAAHIAKSIFEECLVIEQHESLKEGNREINNVVYHWIMEKTGDLPACEILRGTEIIVIKINWKKYERHELDFPFIRQEHVSD